MLRKRQSLETPRGVEHGDVLGFKAGTMKGLMYPYDESYSTVAEWGQYPGFRVFFWGPEPEIDPLVAKTKGKKSEPCVPPTQHPSPPHPRGAPKTLKHTSPKPYKKKYQVSQ